MDTTTPTPALSAEVEELIAKIKLCNNGYIFAPTGKDVRVARENPTKFKMVLGTIPGATYTIYAK